MAADSYEEGLSWGVENDPTHVDAPVAEHAADGTEPEEAGMGSALLVTLGVFGGVFLLFTIGWIINLQGFAVQGSNPFFDFMTRLGDVLAIVSPAAWFISVISFTRNRSSVVRIIWLLFGIVIAAPWPFILAAGAK